MTVCVHIIYFFVFYLKNDKDNNRNVANLTFTFTVIKLLLAYFIYFPI